MPGGVFGVSFGAGGSVRDVIRGILTPDNSDKLGLVPTADDANTQCQGFDPGCGLHQFVNNIIGGLGDAIGGIIGLLISTIIGMLGIIVVLIAILYSMIRLWFSLLLSYVYILLDVLLGPFMIMFGVFPGSKIGFSAWARDILANLMAFPTAIAMFLLGRLLMDAMISSAPTNGVSSGTSQLFVPPLIGNPIGTSGNGNPLGFLIGLGVILMTPQVVNMMKALFKAPDNKFTQQIFQSVGAGTGFGAISKAGSIGYTISGLRSLPIAGRLFGKAAPGTTVHPPAGGGHG